MQVLVIALLHNVWCPKSETPSKGFEVIWKKGIYFTGTGEQRQKLGGGYTGEQDNIGELGTEENKYPILGNRETSQFIQGDN